MKGAMIGAGYFARHHADAWRRMAGVEIVGVADRQEGRAGEFAARWGIARSYGDVSEMLERERPDFVDIVTPPETHLELVRQVAEHGAQIICQKPMAPRWEDCLAMVETARRSGVRLIMHENWRFQPWFREIRRLIDEGFCGRIFQAGFFMRSGDGRGGELAYSEQPYFRTMERMLVYEMLVHLIDTLRFLIAGIESVCCQIFRVNKSIRGEDGAVIMLKFESGASGLIDANRWSGRPKPALTNQTLLVEGERGTIRMTPEGDLWLDDYTGPERLHDFERVRIDGIGYKGDSVRAAQTHFIDSLLRGERSETEGEEYLKTVAAVFACYESADSGQVVRIKEKYNNLSGC